MPQPCVFYVVSLHLKVVQTIHQLYSCPALNFRPPSVPALPARQPCGGRARAAVSAAGTEGGEDSAQGARRGDEGGAAERQVRKEQTLTNYLSKSS